MNSSRLMVRLIDIALIILLGFIAISRLKTDYVDLPSPGNLTPVPERVRQTALHIYADRVVINDRGSRKTAHDLQELETDLLQLQQHYADRGTRVMMQIESHRSALLQDLVDVLDVLQRHSIDKSLDYDRIN